MKLINDIFEAKNHLGEKTYRTFQGWKRACRLVDPQCTFEGDKEVCNAKPGVGEWDGESGCVYLKEQEDFDVLAAAEREGETPDEFADETGYDEDEQDSITMDVPLLIRMFEVMREEVQSDEQLHDIVERILSMKNKGTLTMDDYEAIIPTEPNGEGEEW
jgi:hypothetical protein